MLLLATRHKIAKNWDLNLLDLIDENIMVEPDCIKEWAIEAEAEAKTVKGVTQVQSSSASVGMVNSYLATSNGFSAGYSRSSANISCVSISGKGLEMERDYAYEGRVLCFGFTCSFCCWLAVRAKGCRAVWFKKSSYR